MTEEVATDPMIRIDRALARIEAVAQRPPTGDDTLAQRHAELRSTVARAIAALDDMIADAPD